MISRTYKPEYLPACNNEDILDNNIEFSVLSESAMNKIQGVDFDSFEIDSPSPIKVVNDSESVEK